MTENISTGATTDGINVQSSKSTSYRWVIIALAFIITLVNYMDRSALSYAIGPLKDEFHITDTQYGYVASAFAVGYMIMTTGGGMMVDRWGAHKVWAGAALMWSLCTAMLGLAANLPLLFAFRTLLGLAEGPHFPALTRVVADWLPSNERARATAIGLAAVPLANVIGAPLITNLITTFGWKVMFAILGSFGIVWAVAWWFAFRDYPESSKLVGDKELMYIRGTATADRSRTSAEIRSHELAAGTTTWRFMLLNRSLMANNYAFFAFGYTLFFALTWLPGYFKMQFGLNLKEIGIFLIAPWLTAAILLALAGFLSDWLWQKTGSMRVARSHMIWICQLISGICFIPMLFLGNDLNASLIMISLGIGFGLMPNACFYALNCDLAKDRAATSLGLMDSFFALAGILAPSLTGWLSDLTGSFNAAFALLIFFTLTSVAAVLIFQKPDQIEPSASV
ncbi:MAG: MFS transporter [Candidatus Melainabacteria bacterium]|nr:MFS transporter [Candidatus Melainabacteria bacterium]